MEQTGAIQDKTISFSHLDLLLLQIRFPIIGYSNLIGTAKSVEYHLSPSLKIPTIAADANWLEEGERIETGRPQYEIFDEDNRKTTYIFSSMILRKGENSKEGHFCAIVRKKGRFYHCDDFSVSQLKGQRLETGGTSKTIEPI
jgi:hypothetical protein